MNTHLIEQSITKKNRKAIGNRSPYAGPVDMVETKDGWIVVQVLGDTLFKRWANLVGAEDLLDDDRFSTDINRGVNGEILSKKTSDWASQYTNEEALNLLANANVPAGPVNDLQDALDDPHVKAMNFFQDLEYPGIPGKSPVMGLPVKLSNSDNKIERRPPILGEHTEEILIDLGFTNDEIDEFKEKRII